MRRFVISFAIFYLISIAGYSERLSAQTFFNPLLPGDHPDPSILYDGGKYYIACSSFEYYPGLPIYQSDDLINWTPLTNALSKYLGSVWAPDLVKYEGKYYIYFPANDNIYVVWAESIEGPWSEPVDLKIKNIDPGHIADDNGNRYLYSANGGYVPLSKDGLSVVGETIHVFDGWKIPREWSIECFCMEGPKLVKRGDYYYLTVAEGGTAGPATGHMVVSARSRYPIGPWENSPYNPILRTTNPSEQWCSQGHGTIFEAKYGKWWMLYHSYENGYYNMGRQAMLIPIEWTPDGWWRIPKGINASKPIKLPAGANPQKRTPLSDDFSNKMLSPQWQFYGEYDPLRYSIEDGAIAISAKGHSIADCSPMLCVPQDHSYMIDVEITTSHGAQGGLALFYNPAFASGIIADSTNILSNLRGWQFVTEKDVFEGGHVFLRLINYENTVDMFYSTDGTTWTKTENSFSVSGLHHNVLSGFMSLRIGLCAIGEGIVRFDNFTYSPLIPSK